jgi:hypothetical protein
MVRYQVTQVAPSRLRVSAHTEYDGNQEITRTRIQEVLRSAIPGELAVDVDFVRRFELGPQAKFRVVRPLLQSRHPTETA